MDSARVDTVRSLSGKVSITCRSCACIQLDTRDLMLRLERAGTGAEAFYHISLGLFSCGRQRCMAVRIVCTACSAERTRRQTFSSSPRLCFTSCRRDFECTPQEMRLGGAQQCPRRRAHHRPKIDGLALRALRDENPKMCHELQQGTTTLRAAVAAVAL